MKIFFVFFCLIIIGCSSKNISNNTIGISLPDKYLQRWNQDGNNLKENLEEKGYKVILEYGDNDINKQCKQIANMINNNCKAILITPIDCSSLYETLEAARLKSIPIIAYDRLILNTNAVSYYIAFNNFDVGMQQGNFLIKQLCLEERSKDNPSYIEYFTGSPDDYNINYYFEGLFTVLRPYISKGSLVTRSGQTNINQCAIVNWSSKEAERRMDSLILKNKYIPGENKLDAVYSSNDSIALGISHSLVKAGYTHNNFPIITGQDCDIKNIKNMLNARQAMSIFKDTRELASHASTMIDSIIKGEEPEITDTQNYFNGSKIVPAHLCTTETVTVDNYKEVLIDSGYYSPRKFKRL